MTDSSGLPPVLARDIAAANAGRFEDREGPEPWQKPGPDPTRLEYARRILRETPPADRMATAYGLISAYAVLPDPDAIAGVRAVIQAGEEIYSVGRGGAT
jgi:hypothetical protein